jgi:ricin-type beta-trefoil lectin protein
VKLIWPNRATGFCLGVKAGTMTDGTRIIVWTCNNTTDQTWTADPLNADGTGPFRLRNGSNRNMCLSVSNNSTANGAPLVIWGCKAFNNADQLWTFENGQLPDCTIFRNVNSGRVMGVTNQNVAEGTPVIQWSYLVHGDQEWCARTAPAN